MNTIVKQYDVDFDLTFEVESGFFYFIKCNIVLLLDLNEVSELFYL